MYCSPAAIAPVSRGHELVSLPTPLRHACPGGDSERWADGWAASYSGSRAVVFPPGQAGGKLTLGVKQATSTAVTQVHAGSGGLGSSHVNDRRRNDQPAGQGFGDPGARTRIFQKRPAANLMKCPGSCFGRIEH